MLDENPVPYGMYYVDKEYINALINELRERKKEPRIIDPEVTNLYCGPVLRVDDVWGFYAPVLSMPDNADGEPFLSKDMAVSGFVYVVKMIPCCAKLLTACTEDTPESEFCMKSENRKFIEWLAEEAYEASEEK